MHLGQHSIEQYQNPKPLIPSGATGHSAHKFITDHAKQHHKHRNST